MRTRSALVVFLSLGCLSFPCLTETILDYGHSRYGSTLEDLRRFAFCDGRGVDTVLELWADLPLQVHVPSHTWSHFGDEIEYEAIFWDVVDRLETKLGGITGVDSDLFEPAASHVSADVSVDYVHSLTWAQFEEFDWQRSGAPKKAKLHVRYFTTRNTADLALEIEHALIWLLIGGDGDLPWPHPTRRFRTQTTDLSNLDIVDSLPTTADYEILALALSLDDGVDLHALDCGKDLAPVLNVGLPSGAIEPWDVVLIDASGSTDPEGAPVELKLSQAQGYTEATIAADDSGRFVVQLPASGDYVFEITAHDGHGNTASERIHLYALGACPEPSPVETREDLIVATHYLSTWGRKNNDWRTQSENIGDRSYDLSFADPRYHPVLGNYEAADPVVGDWHIKMAVENGVNCFFVVSTRPAFESSTERSFEEGLLGSQYIDRIKFCMELNLASWWQNDGFFWGIDIDGIVEETVGYYCRNYFDHPSYLRIDDSPVLVIFREQVHYGRSGQSARDRFLDKIREVARSHGYELYLVGDVLDYNEDPKWVRGVTDPFQCASAYWTTGVHWQFRNGIPYVDVSFSENSGTLAEQFAFYRGFLEQREAILAPAISVGFDNTPPFEIGIDNWLWRQTEPTESEIKWLAEAALQSVDEEIPMLVVYAWNEIHEGGVLEPTHEKGYEYLEALRDVVAIEPVGGWPENSLTLAGEPDEILEPGATSCILPSSTHDADSGDLEGIGFSGQTGTRLELGSEMSCSTVDLSEIAWQASTDEDNDEDDPAKEAAVIEGSDQWGAFYGMSWDSTGPVDFDLNDLHRFDRSGTEGFELMLSASEPMEVQVWVGVGDAHECEDRSSGYVLCDETLQVGTEPETLRLGYWLFSRDPVGPCDTPLTTAALESLFAIILWPEASKGELRVYEVSLCSDRQEIGVAEESFADVYSQEWDEASLPVIDRFDSGSLVSSGGTLWHLDEGADIVTGERSGVLYMESTDFAEVSATLPLGGLPFDGYDGYYVLVSGALWAQLDAEIAASIAGEIHEQPSARAFILNDQIREFRVPFDWGSRGDNIAGTQLTLELRNTYGSATAAIHEIGLYAADDPAHEAAHQVLWITTLPEPDPSTQGMPSTVIDVGDLEFMGNPFALRFPDRSGWENARSVWDMQFWNERLYLAHGDAHSNAGPTDVWYYEPESNRFIKETTIDEEEIRSYVITADTLLIPGFDPREQGDSEEWRWGNLYRHTDGEWTKLRTIPWGLHLYDVLSSEGTLFVTGDGSEAYVSQREMKLAFTHVSEDGGLTWNLHYPSDANRIEELFELNGCVFASGAYDSILFRWTGTDFEPLPVDPFPNLPPFGDHDYEKSFAPMLPSEWQGDPSALLRAGHATDWRDGVLYICEYPYTRQPSEVNGTRHVPESVGIYFATSITDDGIQRMEFLADDLMPRDIVVRDDTAYVLAVGKELDSSRARVYSASTPESWEMLFSCDSFPASVYSMEVGNSRIYLGLGGPSVHSGEVYAFQIPAFTIDPDVTLDSVIRVGDGPQVLSTDIKFYPNTRRAKSGDTVYWTLEIGEASGLEPPFAVVPDLDNGYSTQESATTSERSTVFSVSYREGNLYLPFLSVTDKNGSSRTVYTNNLLQVDPTYPRQERLGIDIPTAADPVGSVVKGATLRTVNLAMFNSTEGRQFIADEIAKWTSMGINHVTISSIWVTESFDTAIHLPIYHHRPWFVSISGTIPVVTMFELTDLLHEAGMTVAWRYEFVGGPNVDVMMRLGYDPSERSIYFDHQQQIHSFLAMCAERAGADMYCIDTENPMMSVDPRARDIVESVRSEFSGPVSICETAEVAMRSVSNPLCDLVYFSLGPVGFDDMKEASASEFRKAFDTQILCQCQRPIRRWDSHGAGKDHTVLAQPDRTQTRKAPRGKRFRCWLLG